MHSWAVEGRPVAAIEPVATAAAPSAWSMTSGHAAIADCGAPVVAVGRNN